MLVTAESCTGGLIASAMTELPGSSSVFERGFVTYSNESKHELLRVSGTILQESGAVSEECAYAMAEGALLNSKAQRSISITGIAGPSGGREEKPVGLVYIGIGKKGGKVSVYENNFDGTRSDIRLASAKAAFMFLIQDLRD